MTQRRIIIPTDRDGEPVGAQIKAILDRQVGYRVVLVDLHARLDAMNELAIPVVPSSIEKAERFLEDLRAQDAQIPILPVVPSENLSRIESLCSWTGDFLVSPIREPEVDTRVRRILSGEDQRPSDALNTPLNGTVPQLTQLVGEDPVFIAVKQKIPRVAQSERTVLIVGETGTGKELCARALHYLSPRADRPFIPMNCGAIPFDLFERELFGHQKGAFTSAWTAQPGLLAEAEGGTLFLDEIEALPLLAQVKFLRFLQDRTYCVLGSPKTKQANVRIIASTNVDLNRKIQDGTFREDLFYRLAVLILNLPPLRERRSDVPLLARHFWSLYADDEEYGGRKRLSPAALETLGLYSWPGNVRELENVIHQILILAEDELIEPRDLPLPQPPASLSQIASHKEAKARAIEQFERNYIGELLQKHNGNVTRAAREAKKDRRAMGRLIKKYHSPNPGRF